MSITIVNVIITVMADIIIADWEESILKVIWMWSQHAHAHTKQKPLAISYPWSCLPSEPALGHLLESAEANSPSYKGFTDEGVDTHLCQHPQHAETCYNYYLYTFTQLHYFLAHIHVIRTPVLGDDWVVLVLVDCLLAVLLVVDCIFDVWPLIIWKTF